MTTPAGAIQWKTVGGDDLVPDAHDATKRHAPVMTTADLALRFDPIYEPIARHFMENPAEFADAFARAWFKLLHRDMGPKARYLGSEVPAEDLIWQDPVPAVDHALVDAQDIAALKETVLASGLTVSQLVSTAWASAATFRGTDKRGGANGARIRLEPQSGWEVNDPAELATVLRTLEGIQARVQRQRGRRQEDLAGRPDRPRRLRCGGEGGEGCRRRPSRCRSPRVARMPRPSRPTSSRSPCSSRRSTASATTWPRATHVPAEHLLVERAALLTLSAPEMTVLVAGMRALDANSGQSALGRPHLASGRADERRARQPARHGHGVEADR